MQPIAYLGMLLLLTAQVQTAPSSLHSHLQRHRDRAAIHAHLSHRHFQLDKRAETAPMKLLREPVPEIHRLVTEKPPATLPYEQPGLMSKEYEDDRPRTTSTEAETSSQRETGKTTALEESEPRRIKLAVVRDRNVLKSGADSTDSRHIDAAMRLLRAHAIVKHNRFQREM